MAKTTSDAWASRLREAVETTYGAENIKSYDAKSGVITLSSGEKLSLLSPSAFKTHVKGVLKENEANWRKLKEPITEKINALREERRKYRELISASRAFRHGESNDAPVDVEGNEIQIVLKLVPHVEKSAEAPSSPAETEENIVIEEETPSESQTPAKSSGKKSKKGKK